MVTESSLERGEFNNCEHLFLEIAPDDKFSTISCKLPNGKFVTFSFVPGNPKGKEMECVDIHSTVGQPWKDKDGRTHYNQHLVGFVDGTDSFDTRELKTKTGLATLLLNKSHHE